MEGYDIVEERILTGTMRHCVERCINLLHQGWIVKETYKTHFIHWPRFWQRIYSVTLVRRKTLNQAIEDLDRPLCYRNESIEAQLKRAIESEDYLLAAKLRDQINKA